MINKLTDMEYIYYKDDSKYRRIKEFENVIFNNQFTTVAFDLGTHELEGLNLIRINTVSFYGSKSLKTGITHRGVNSSTWVFSVDKETGNKIYKQILNGKFKSKADNECYRINIKTIDISDFKTSNSYSYK